MPVAQSFAFIAMLAGALALATPAAGQSKEDLRTLSDAYKLIEDDETAKAIEQLNTLLEEKPGDPDTSAKAMLLRGQAYAKAGRHAQALSDFNAALWLQGLNSGQRKDAVAGRKAALAKLGLADESADEEQVAAETSSPSQTESIPTSIPTSTDSEPETPAPAQTASAPETPPEPAAGAWQTNVQAAEAAREPEAEDSDGIGSFFSNLFGGSDEPEPEPARETETAAVSGWTASTTDVTASNAPAAADGREYRIQLASVGTREGAESEVRRLSRLLGEAIQGESPDIVRTDTEAGNTYYRIVVGPQPSRDAADAMCNDFKSRGVDCLVVSGR